MPAALVTLAALGATVLLLWRKPALGLGGAWFFLILAPTSTFLPLAGELVAERRLYLPLVGPAVLAAAALALWQTKHRIAATATGALIVAALLATTIARNADYRSAASILGDNVSKRPGNARVRYNYGNALKDEGHIDLALGEYRECIRRDPGYMDCFANAVVAGGHLQLERAQLAEGATAKRRAKRQKKKAKAKAKKQKLEGGTSAGPEAPRAPRGAEGPPGEGGEDGSSSEEEDDDKPGLD